MEKSLAIQNTETKSSKKKPSSYSKKCVICNKRRSPQLNLILSRMPLDPIRCKKWVKAIGQEELVYLPIEKLHQLKVVCNLHFKKEDFNQKHTQLLKHAVPTLNLPLKPLEESVLLNFPFYVGQYPKHEYVKKESQCDEDLSIDDNQVETASLGELSNPTSPQQHEESGMQDGLQSNGVELTSGATEHETLLLVNLSNYSPPHHYEELDTLNDISYLDSEILMSNSITKTKLEDIESVAVSDYKHDEISLQSQNRESSGAKDLVPISLTGRNRISIKGLTRRKSPENDYSNGLNVREQKLLQKLKTPNLTLKKLAKTSLDLDKIDDTLLRKLVSVTVKNYRNKSIDKRCSMKTKMWALSIFHKSPKAYRYFQWALYVPSIKALHRLQRLVRMEPGININLIKKCKDKLSTLSEQSKHCALLFDVMALKNKLIYNENNDEEGFIDDDKSSSKIVDHVLIFMVQGLNKKFKLPIAYYFLHGTISPDKLCYTIKKTIMTLEQTDLKIVTIVCDHSPTNMAALCLIKQFCNQVPDENYFTIKENNKIFIMFDIPHLFISIRNNFYSAGEIVWGGKTGMWRYLVEAEAKNRQFLNFHKLTKDVVNPTCELRRRVKYAAHALSNTMSAIIQMVASLNDEHAKEITETADIIKELDKLFDICNGPSSPEDIKRGIRENVTSTTNHVEMWRYFLTKIEGMQFQNPDSKLRFINKRCITGFKISLKSLEDIWNIVQREGFKNLNLRQLNLDSLENLFAMIREYGFTSQNQSCSRFTSALKTTLLTGLIKPHSRVSNCEPDANSFLINYNTVRRILNEYD